MVNQSDNASNMKVSARFVKTARNSLGKKNLAEERPLPKKSIPLPSHFRNVQHNASALINYTRTAATRLQKRPFPGESVRQSVRRGDCVMSVPAG